MKNATQTFNPVIVTMKFQGVFRTNEFTWTVFNASGLKTGEYRYTKVK